MKLLKWSWLGVFALVFLAIACQKDVSNNDQNSELTLAKGGVPGAPITVDPGADFQISLNYISGATDCTPLILRAVALNPGDNEPGNAGTITIRGYSDALLTTEIAGSPWTENDPDFTANIGTLAAGWYYFVATFDLGANNVSSLTLPIQVTECGSVAVNCEDPVLTAVGITAYLTNGATGECRTPAVFEARYRVELCDEATWVNPLKLQGGLTNGTALTAVYSVPNGTPFYPFNGQTIGGIQYAVSSKQTGNGNNANNVTTWLFSPTVGTNYSQDFTVLFTKSKSTSSANYATGEWSLKDASGATIGGYTERLVFGVTGCN